MGKKKEDFPTPKKFTDEAIDNMLRGLASKPYVKECTYDHTKCIFTVKMNGGDEYRSADGEAWYKPGGTARIMMPWQMPHTPVMKIPKGPPKIIEPEHDSIRPWEMAQASVMRGLMDDPYGDATPTQRKIREITNAMQDLLLYKNNKYGDSAINPKKVFYKGDATNSILIRLDDKLGRVMSNTEAKPRVNDVCDIIGYCTLLLISMGVTPEDIAKFKD